MAYTFNPFTGTFDNAPSTLKGDSAYSTLCAISGNLVNYEYLHEGFFPLSGGTLTGSLSSLSSVYVNGEFQAGSGSIATLYISGTAVGVNTEAPNKELTVVGDVSATGVVYADGGNSVLWNDVYTSYSTASSTFLTTETDSQTLSFDEVTKDLSISNGNTISLSALVDATGIDTGVRALTSNWESTYNTVSALSAEWSAADEVMVAQVTNADSVTLNRGDVVYTFGATGDVMSVKLASNSSEATSSKTLGVINETIIPNGIGYATVAGRITKMSFPAPFVDGDALWLGSTPGTFTRVKPVAPNHGVYLGVIERANNGNGIAYIKVQNGYELDELHDVLITSPQTKDLLQRDSSNTLWVNGPLSADASNIVSGTIDAARMPAFNGDITTVAGTTSATVVAIQGEPISTQAPSTGQILQWSGNSWTPGSIPTGGSGGGGLPYYFNFGTEAQSPTTNLSATPNTPKELGTIGTILSSSYTTGNLSQTSYDLVCGFVSLTGNPNTTVIPSGLWDFNIWASSTGTVTNQTMLRLYVYKYDGVNQPTLLAESDDIYLYDPSVTAQYIASVVFPQTNVLLTDRIYIEIRAKATQTNRTVTVYFGNGTPSHLHTTLPSVGGTGLVKVIDGVYQTPASLLVDTDVASNANIAQSKINGLTDLANKVDSTYTTLNSTSADNASVYSSVASASANWQNVYTTVQSKSAIEWDNSLIAQQLSNFLPLSGGTLTGKLTAASNNLSTGLNIGLALTGAQPSLVDNGDIWISNQNKFTWRSGGNSIAAAGLSQQNTFNNAQTIGASTSLTLLNVGNTGTGSAAIFTAQGSNAAVRITQTGSGNALTIEDSTNPDATPFVVDAFGSVGIGLSSLVGVSTKLTVIGSISSTETLYDSEGNSNFWNSAYTTVYANSASWGIDSTIDTEVRALTSSWDSTYSTVQTNSATTWNYQGTDLKDLSASWQNTYTTVNLFSSSWEESSDIIPTATNYLSTNNVLLSGLTVTTTISAKDKIYVADKQVVTTNITTVPGTSAISTIVAVSALPVTQVPGTLYILV